MRTWSFVRAIAPLAAALAMLLPAASAQEQNADSGAPAAAQQVELNVDVVLHDGQELELQKKWADAFTLYDDALERFPDHSGLKHRYNVTRMHYDLGRRYADSSYKASIGKMAQGESLRLYSEVMLKLHTHYVDTPDWRHLVNQGTLMLEVALTDDVFLKAQLPNVPVAKVNEYRRDLRNRLAARTIRSRHDARDAVSYAAWLADRPLGLSQNAAILEYTCGATNSLDDYSAFLSSGELSDVYAQIEGNFVGLGVELKPEADSLLIIRVIPGSPAEKGGIKPGDRITAVDGRSTSEMTADQAADRLQGPEGSVVGVTMVTPNMEPRSIQITRAQIDVPSVTDTKILDPSLGVAYLKLNSFQKTTSSDLDKALWSLHRQGMKSLIMDLRGNPGGLLTASVEAADKFVDSGVVVSTRGRNAGEDYTYKAHDAGTWRVPLIVLIDGDSASASEIFAGAIRDHRRGTIIGTRSYGKGSVQGIFSLNVGGSGIRLTTAKFYSPQGKPFSKVGVSPDMEVRQAARPVGGVIPTPTGKDDVVVAAALRVARERTARRTTSGSR